MSQLTTSRLQDAGQMIMSQNSDFNQSAFIQNRRKPMPATFSKKNLNLTHTQNKMLQPVSPLINQNMDKHAQTMKPDETVAGKQQIVYRDPTLGEMGTTASMSDRYNTQPQGQQRRQPTKQGKSFALDLGQNSGPYKSHQLYGNPLIDMFSPQAFAEREQDKSTGSIKLKKTHSPRIGILGSSTFSPDASTRQRRLDAEPSNTVNKQFKRIEEQMVLGYEILAGYKQDAEILHHDVEVLMNQLMDQVDSVMDDVQPELYQDYKTLKKAIKKQKEDNEQLQKLLDVEKIKTQDQREMVRLCQERVLRMEEQVGIIADNPNYFGAGSEDEEQNYQDEVQSQSMGGNLDPYNDMKPSTIGATGLVNSDFDKPIAVQDQEQIEDGEVKRHNIIPASVSSLGQLNIGSISKPTTGNQKDSLDMTRQNSDNSDLKSAMEQA